MTSRSKRSSLTVGKKINASRAYLLRMAFDLTNLILGMCSTDTVAIVFNYIPSRMVFGAFLITLKNGNILYILR